MTTWARRLAAGVAAAAVAGAVGTPADAEPTMRLSTATARPGDRIAVYTTGWPATTTASVCGNNGRRGAVDCDQVSSVGMGASVDKPQARDLVVTVPPQPCPCVVRVATAGEALVQTLPLVIKGVPVAPVIEPATTEARLLRVTARLGPAANSMLEKLRSALGGRTRRTLVLRVTNLSDTPVQGVTVTAALARSSQGGEPLQPPNVGLILPGATRTYRIPVSLGTPSFGTYVAYGAVYGPGVPANFAARTHTTPWLLVVLLVFLLVDIALLLRRHARRRSVRDLQAPEPTESGTETADEHTVTSAS